MFRKTTSDERPDLGQAIAGELKPYCRKAIDFARYVVCSYPRQIFGIMIGMMVISAVLTLKVFRHPQKAVHQVASVKPPQGLAPVLNTAMKLNYLWRLQGQIDGLLQKKRLEHADSLLLQNALVQMDSLRRQVRDADRDFNHHKSSTTP